ncbi:VanW family protein [Cohnella silvisoli]|uniref:VanW family protein n=1 Tax=Cohnella silvisoli TaxID=2873699 RepID=A0ABV1KPV8_9BACL|nr:VanW family protein [Cohnella silvisoli]MCD9020900.1 VanW family protein [Cohnella silvisoli]
MGLQWIAGVILLFQLASLPDTLQISRQGHPIAIVKRSEYAFPLPGLPLVNDIKFTKLMDKMGKLAHRSPVNAALDEGGRIIPEKTGTELDRLSFANMLYGFIVEGTSSSIEVPLLTTYPKVDSELLASVREKMIGQYTTYFNSNNRNRAKNIDLAAKAINNQFVFPGETFSFNEIVGERSEKKGYLRAKIIVKGEVSEGIGGGICQISSTLYNAADRAGLQIVQRYSHSRSVPYVPPGRDATVSWYGPDFVFRNKYNQPVLIRASAHGGQVTIMIYSSDMVNYKPRDVPSASKQLPKEIISDQNVNGIEP